MVKPQEDMGREGIHPSPMHCRGTSRIRNCRPLSLSLSLSFSFSLSLSLSFQLSLSLHLSLALSLKISLSLSVHASLSLSLCLSLSLSRYPSLSLGANRSARLRASMTFIFSSWLPCYRGTSLIRNCLQNATVADVPRS